MREFDFIFMLTRDDRTVPDAAERLKAALAAGVRHIGFKDIGLPFGALAELRAMLAADGATSYLEVVSLDRASEIASVEAGAELGVDVLLGGTHVPDALAILAGTGIRYLPFVGAISGHPSVLGGTIEEIVAQARTLTALEGVDGLDLLAYRSATDVPVLIREVCAAAGKPVIVAGSVDAPGRIAAARDGGAAGFTVGTAALDGRFPGAGSDLAAQLAAILAAGR